MEINVTLKRETKDFLSTIACGDKTAAIGFEAILTASDPCELYCIMAEYHKAVRPNRLPHYRPTLVDALHAWAQEKNITSAINGDCVEINTGSGSWLYRRLENGTYLSQFVWG